MKKSAIALMPAIVAASCLLGTSASALPQGWFDMGGVVHDISSTSWVEMGDGTWVTNFDYADPQLVLHGHAVVLSDPGIVYGIAIQNHTGSPMNFTFDYTNTFATGIAGPNAVFGSFSGSGTDATGDGYRITPTGTKIQVTDLNGFNAGVDVGDGFTFGPGFPGTSYALGYFNKGPQSGPVATTSWTQLHTRVSFTLTGNEDVATLNGAAAISAERPVPEPASALLLAPGLVGLYLWRRRRS